MKKVLYIVACGALTLAAFGAKKNGSPIREDYKEFADARRYVVSRVVENGKVITTWHRNGRPDWILPAVETNNLKHIAGVQQNNPIQDMLERVRAEARANWTAYTNQVTKTVAYSNAYVIAQGMANVAQAKIQGEIEDLQEKIAKYEDYQTKYPLLKAVFATFIADAQNRIKVLQSLGGGTAE